MISGRNSTTSNRIGLGFFLLIFPFIAATSFPKIFSALLTSSYLRMLFPVEQLCFQFAVGFFLFGNSGTVASFVRTVSSCNVPFGDNALPIFLCRISRFGYYSRKNSTMVLLCRYFRPANLLLWCLDCFEIQLIPSSNTQQQLCQVSVLKSSKWMS